MQAVYLPVQRELAEVETLLQKNLRSRARLTDDVGGHITFAGGKRLRPLLALLAAGCCGDIDERHLHLAAAVEFLHTATLLHDDVVDGAMQRRGRPSANNHWGNSASVLVGDFLYSRAFQMLFRTDNVEVLNCMTDTGNRLAEGEVLQLSRIGDLELGEEEYFALITAKTALVFQSAARCSALLSGATREHCDALGEFGLQLGLAFQLRDDVLDYDGDAAVMGKPAGQDLREGKITLPLIAALCTADDAVRQLVRAALAAPEEARPFAGVQQAVRDCGALEYTLQQARQHRERALEALTPLPDSGYREGLVQLAAVAVERSE